MNSKLEEMGLRLSGAQLLSVKRCREPRGVMYEHRDTLPMLRQLEGRLVTVEAMRSALRAINARVEELNARVNAHRAEKDRLAPATLRLSVPVNTRHGYVETEEGSVFSAFDIIDGIVDIIKGEDHQQPNTQSACAEK